MPTNLSTETQKQVEHLTTRVEFLAIFQQAIITALIPLFKLTRFHPHLATRFGELMAKTQQELLDEIGSLKQAITDDSTSDQAVVAQLDGIITDLKNQVSALQTAGIDTDALFASLEDAKTAISPVTSTNQIGSVDINNPGGV